MMVARWVATVVQCVVGIGHGQCVLYSSTSVLSMLLLSPCTATVNCLQYCGKGGFVHHGLIGFA